MVNYELPRMKYPEQKGLVSIIVPIYNDEAALGECLDSILAQTFANWEAILVDDGSTDCTGKIIDEYAKKDLRFIAVRKQNEGTLQARKTGLENSKGEFIASIDHDDTYHPMFLEKMYAKITETNADFAYCKFREMGNDGEPQTKNCECSVEASENAANIFTPSGMACVMWNKLIRREIYAKVNFPSTHIIFGEDIIQTFQIAYHSKTFAFISDVLYFYKDGGVTSKIDFSNASYEIIDVYEALDFFFKGNIPQNVKNSFYRRYGFVAYNYFLLDKKQRAEFGNKLKPFLPEIIKRLENSSLKTCLFLANNGIEFPFALRENIKKTFQKSKACANSKAAK